ncbi:Two-component sensor PilS [Methylophaga frappieri]|uniref:histidine kinase n=1 Tax=Methylophaga frappieri (strain ATCC BAA-2434 / DSM 25690 / JAM7) TaxID=754477 RepID=I1YFB6_METFJ|nr:HAMP domain-containing sensor histidine kinase [Methylophaga frappieri]AFJ01609.1 Two-component sensor PilS [Methylophaga frappieri]
MADPDIVSDPVIVDNPWRALRLFSGYRLFLATVLFAVSFWQLPPDYLGQKLPDLFQLIAAGYLLLAVGLLWLCLRDGGEFVSQCRWQLLLDILMLSLIIHTSGGLQTGLGALLIVIVVAGGAMIPGRMAAFIAAVATLAVLIEATYGEVAGQNTGHFSQAGILGAIFFVTALLAQIVSQTMQRSQSLAEQRASELNKLANLNQHIIQRMQDAVLAIDMQGRVSLFNESARKLLAIAEQQPGFLLKEAVPELASQLQRWHLRDPEAFQPFQPRHDLPELQARATRVETGETLIFVENITELAQQAQQLKLASLGRLTASIAHEIRNPLSAISHAGELLAEQRSGDASINKLTAIIQRHSSRMNLIIETILQMSRRKSTQPGSVLLATWLEKLIEEFSETKALPASKLQLTVKQPLTRVRTDPQQLHQILWNLLDNGLHHADLSADTPLAIVVEEHADQVWIDVLDNGQGVSEKALKHLFEPFYSARQGGTGLGLYLARELCQANGARLHYLADAGSCFRITFPVQK